MKMGLLTSPSSTLFFFSSSHSKFNLFHLHLRILTLNSFSSLRTKPPSLTKWSSLPPPPTTHDDDDLFDPFPPHTDDSKPLNAIDRVVHRLRKLGSNSHHDEDEPPPHDGFLRREWVRPDAPMAVDTVLPWENDEELPRVRGEDEGGKGLRKKTVKAPSLAELALGVDEVKRLRRVGMLVKERVSVPKAGLTQAVLHKIHSHWRNCEVVRLKFHELLAQNMKLAQQIVERRTRGLIIWSSGSVLWVYRGRNYEGPIPSNQWNGKGGDDRLLVTDVSLDSNATSSLPEKSDPIWWNQQQPQNMTPEEAEFDRMLDDFGPRFVEWWGTGILPVDADLLPPKVTGYKAPLRLLPAGMRSRITEDELTKLRKLSKALPCHFALGRNRDLQGLACAILKLWEKSLVAKIAVKRGIQNTNNELMADELKKLTGGALLLRNKYFIVIYRGKDFVPTSVAAVLAERQELTKQVQDAEEKVRCRTVDETLSGEDDANGQAGSLAEFYEAQARWGRDISNKEREKMMKEATEAKNVRLIKKVELKLASAQAKRLRAEKLLAKVEASLVPAVPDDDRETITDEERIMFRSVGLTMKAYLQLGTRGVFDGVIENMHLHWRHRELVKLITKQKTLAFVEDTARLLEYESGGILVAIDRLPKGFSLIYYRGKNYRRPISLWPRNLLTKAKALQRSINMQRHEALSQHITELEKKIEKMKKELSGDEGSSPQVIDGDFDDKKDSDCDEDYEISSLEK
ncbi:CRM-domain containing factor CFM3, chloroplastic/mitochondrial-like [Lotus japonicus]|uniref:CRM-domain containing factor CFM3, chloroplastic/mitochondrial-like n=1 Tax=Lotus japonicus TaxID=34305 RepID=UPI00258FDF98|nr:CRM-domain containing factor CFM3, chloroplastic/mitochondrial-like [Lotus japonicus]